MTFLAAFGKTADSLRNKKPFIKVFHLSIFFEFLVGIFYSIQKYVIQIPPPTRPPKNPLPIKIEKKILRPNCLTFFSNVFLHEINPL